MGLAEKPRRKPNSITPDRVPVYQLKIGPHIVQHHHDISQQPGGKIRIQTCQCARRPKPVPKALSLSYPWFRPASTGVWHLVQVYLRKRGTNHLTVVEAVVATKG